MFYLLSFGGSGDAFVMRIGEDLDSFRSTYKNRFNIPQKQEALK